jgi:OmpA-OmpF porin, OOP family
MKKSFFAVVPNIVGLAMLVSAAAHAQVILVPAPAPLHEATPAPRPGQSWQSGYWRWEHGRYGWTPGTWAQRVTVEPGAYRIPVEAEPPPPRVERLSTDALFPFDRGDAADIRSSGLADLAQIAARLRASRFSHVEVRGYTDPLGSDGYNLNLSERRANAVKAALIQQGVPAEKIQAEGLGSQDVVVQCDNLSAEALIKCLQPDRRVEIVTYVRDDLQRQQHWR